jgi:hypothetical protein
LSNTMDDNYNQYVTNNGSDNAIAKKDSFKRGGERSIKLTFSHLVKLDNARDKRLFIDTVQKYVINNSEIAVRLSIIMHHIVMQCVHDNGTLPNDFCSRRFLEQASNWTGWRYTPHHLVSNACVDFGAFAPTYAHLDGKSWLLGYLQSCYNGNIVTSIKGKWKAFINDSIDTYIKIHRRDASDQLCRRTMMELRRQILTPAKPRPNTAPQLDEHAEELVIFHRQGFRLEGDEPLTDDTIADGKDKYHHYILHFGHCLRREEALESAHNDIHPPKYHIHLKKRMPLPFFGIGSRKSVQIDKKGMFWILKEFGKAGGQLHHPDAPNMPTQ